MTYYDDPLVTLLHGDCIEVMATLPADSVDAVVTDPPYGLEFMGKEWDSYKESARPPTGPKREAQDRADSSSPLRNRWQAEPGTYHNDTNFLATGDRIRYKAGHPFQVWCEQWGAEALRVTKPGGYLLAFGGTRTHHRLVCALEDAGWIIRDELTWIYASGFPKGKANLKPAHEPIVLARKPGPLRPLAIDECRIGMAEDDPTREWGEKYGGGRLNKQGEEYKTGMFGTGLGQITGTVHPSGRWPSNVLLSDPELFDEPNPYVVGSGATDAGGGYGVRGDGPLDGRTSFALPGQGQVVGYGDSGGYSRFFIVPKADRAERERGLAHSGLPEEIVDIAGLNGPEQRIARGVKPEYAPRQNVHPTVKPIDLMRHLVRLVTPSGGVVLDPFLGSGTTCLAASEEGVRSIGIEREAEYLEIAKDRLIATPMGLGLDVPAPTQWTAKPAPYTGKRHGGVRAGFDPVGARDDPEEVA